MLNYSRAKTNSRGLLLAAAICFALLSGPRQDARSDEPDAAPALTQYRINEFAAECLTCEMAFAGLKGSAKPGETPAQFNARVEGYLAALDHLAKQVEPLRALPRLRDPQPDNVARWKKIARAAAGLPSVARDARAAWHAHLQGVPGAQIGPKLMAGLLSVQALLNTLRDARP